MYNFSLMGWHHYHGTSGNEASSLRKKTDSISRSWVAAAAAAVCPWGWNLTFIMPTWLVRVVQTMHPLMTSDRFKVTKILDRDWFEQSSAAQTIIEQLGANSHLP